LGVIFIIRDKNGEEITRVVAPDGATIEVVPQPKTPAGSPQPATASVVPPQPAPQQVGDLDRAVAEWVLGGVGTVRNGSQNIERLADLPSGVLQLTGISPRNRLITVADTKRLTGLKALSAVDIQNCEFAPQALAELAACPQLRGMLFTTCTFQPASLDELLTIKRLRSIGFTSCNMPDSFVARLGELPNLQSIRFFGDKTITDAGLTALAKLPPPKVSYLDLAITDPTKVTAAGLAAIARLPHLRELTISRRELDDQALRALEPATALTTIHLNETQVTREAVEQLQRAIGNCRMVVSTAEQAPSLNGPGYQAVVRKLLKRGFMFQVKAGGKPVVNINANQSAPEEVFTVGRVGLPPTTTIDDLRDLAQLLDVDSVAGSTFDDFPSGGWRELLPLKNLASLTTGDSMFSGEDVKLLLSFPKLRSLTIRVSDDDAVWQIAKLPHLADLTLYGGSEVTDACLKSLEGVAPLATLSLYVQGSGEAAAAFAAARKDVTVTWNGKPADQAAPRPARPGAGRLIELPTR